MRVLPRALHPPRARLCQCLAWTKSPTASTLSSSSSSSFGRPRRRARLISQHEHCLVSSHHPVQSALWSAKRRNKQVRSHNEWRVSLAYLRAVCQHREPSILLIRRRIVVSPPATAVHQANWCFVCQSRQGVLEHLPDCHTHRLCPSRRVISHSGSQPPPSIVVRWDGIHAGTGRCPSRKVQSRWAQRGWMERAVFWTVYS